MKEYQSLPEYLLPDINKLREEQRIVFDVATLTREVEFMLIQGVAGSGKTTIALNILRKIADDAIIGKDKLKPLHERRTAILITYSQKLVEFCKDTLRGYIKHTGMLWEDSNIEPGYINIITYRQFCDLLIEDKSLFLRDEECIRIIEEIRSRRKYDKLLAPQIFSLITTFLKGRYELKDLTYDELEYFLNHQTSPIYKIYKPLLLDVKKKITGEYQDKLKQFNRKDRADLNFVLHDQLLETEELLKHLMGPSVRNINFPSSNQSTTVRALFGWLKTFWSALPHSDVSEIYTEELKKALSLRNLSRAHHEILKNSVPHLICKYGMHGAPLFDRIGERLQNPIILVDELQDLSAVECNILLSFWFQLKKAPQLSRLILFGDLNQQMTPTGFRWEEDVISTIAKLAELYSYDQRRFNPNWTITEKEEDRTTPYRKLNNNYRTTWHIAALAYNMMHQLVPNAIPDQHLRRYYVDNIISPERTYPEHLMEEIESLHNDSLDKGLPSLLEPMLMIGTDDDFLDGLGDFSRQTISELSNLEAENEARMKSLVIITKYPDKLAKLKESQSIKEVLTYYPILGCKGLEFPSCVVWGLPIKESDQSVELDIIGQWYTSLTRAKIKLLIYLTQQEFDYLKKAGWKNFKDICWDSGSEKRESWFWWIEWGFGSNNEREVLRDVSRNSVVECLKDIGLVELGPEALRRAGDIAFNRFKDRKNEETLKEALIYYRKGSWQNDELIARGEAAQLFENDFQFLKAAKYFESCGDIIGLIRCYVREATKIAQINPTQAQTILSEAELRTQSLELDRQHKDAAECWCWLKNWRRGIECAILAGEEITNEICGELVTVVQSLVENEKYKYRGIELDSGAKIDAYSITQILLDFRRYREGGLCKWALGEWYDALRCFILADDLKLAEGVADDLRNSDQKRCWNEISDVYYRKGPDFWPRTMYFLYKSNEPKRPPQQRDDFPSKCLDLDRECQNQRLYIIQTKCWVEIVKFFKEAEFAAIDQATAVANVRQNRREYETAIECWQECRILLDSITLWKKQYDQIAASEIAASWMKIYDRELDQRRLLLGPEDRDYHSTRRHFLELWLSSIEKESQNEASKITISEIRQKIQDDQIDDSLRIKANSIVSTILLKPHWQMEFTSWLQKIERIYRRFGLLDVNQSLFIELKNCVKPESIQLDQLQVRTDTILLIFPEQASNIAQALSLQRGRESDAVKIWYFTCRLAKYRDKAERFINNQLWNKGQLFAAVSCWQSIGFFQEAKANIFKMHFPKDESQATQLLKRLYSGNALALERREALEELKYEVRKSREGKDFIEPSVQPSEPSLHELLSSLYNKVRVLQYTATLPKLILRMVDCCETDRELVKLDWNDLVKARVYALRNQEICELAEKIDQFINTEER